MKENDNEYILEAEMPGVRKEDISIEISDDVLTLGVDTKKKSMRNPRDISTGSVPRFLQAQLSHSEH